MLFIKKNIKVVPCRAKSYLWRILLGELAPRLYNCIESKEIQTIKGKQR